MAEEMQGIMGLQEGQDMGETGQLDPGMFSPIIEGYAKTNPRQFNSDILDSISQVDPAVAQQFVTELSSMQLPPEIIDALQLMVDEILADPSNYAEDRAELIKEGVPEELLPEQFDAAYFAAFNLALDQLDMNQPAAVPAFANGGIIDVKKIAKEIAAMGRNGDTMLAHITPSEARLLRRRGGSGTINPDTGLPEFFFKKVFKSIGKVFKGVTKAVKGIVKGIGKAVKSIAKSAIGKVALTFAAVYFMGPAGLKLAGGTGSITGITNAVAANAVNTFAGSALVNVASGQKIGDAIKGAAVSAALAGGATAIFGGGVPGAPREGGLAPVVDKSTNLASTAGTTLDDLALIKTPSPTAIGPSSVTAATPLPGQAAFEQSMGLSNAYNAGAGTIGAPSVAQTFPLTSVDPVIGNAIGGASPVASSGIGSLQVPGTGIGVGLKNPSLLDMYGAPQTTATSGGIGNLAKAATTTPSVVQQPPGFFESLKQGNLSDAASAAYRNISPSEIQKAGIPAAQEAGSTAIKELVARVPDATAAMKQAAYDSAYNAAMPGMIAKYGPLAAIGAGAAYLGGAFDAPKLTEPANIDEFKTTGADLLAKDPGMYGLDFGGTRTTYAPNPYEKLYAAYETPRVFAKGGEAFPRKTGPINGPGTGTSDSVPAMLSDGEFVFTAKAVRAMGNGSRRKGAKRMYALMKRLEQKG